MKKDILEFVYTSILQILNQICDSIVNIFNAYDKRQQTIVFKYILLNYLKLMIFYKTNKPLF